MSKWRENTPMKRQRRIQKPKKKRKKNECKAPFCLISAAHTYRNLDAASQQRQQVICIFVSFVSAGCSLPALITDHAARMQRRPHRVTFCGLERNAFLSNMPHINCSLLQIKFLNFCSLLPCKAEPEQKPQLQH